MPKPLRKIKKVKITHISLCPKGANGMQTLFKSEGPFFNDIKKQVQSILDNSIPENSYAYIVDMSVSENSVIYELSSYNNDYRSTGTFEVSYSLDQNVLVGEPFEVAERTRYVEIQTLTKSVEEEEGIIYGIMYSPNVKDSHNEFATPEVVKDMMHSFAKSGEGIDINHNFEALSKDDAYVVESFLVQEGDPRFTGLKDYEDKDVNPAGSWAVAIKVENDELLQKYRDGEWKGLSMGGKYQAEEVEEDGTSLLKQVKKLLKSFVGASSQKPKKSKPQTGDTDVTAEELAKAIKDGLDPTNKRLDAVEERLTKVETPAVEDEELEKVDVDLTDQKAVKAHLDTLRKAKLKDEVDVDSIEALEKHLETFNDDADSTTVIKPTSVQTLTKSDIDAEQAEIDDFGKDVYGE